MEEQPLPKQRTLIDRMLGAAKLDVPTPDSELHPDDPFATGGEPYPKLDGG